MTRRAVIGDEVVGWMPSQGSHSQGRKGGGDGECTAQRRNTMVTRRLGRIQVSETEVVGYRLDNDERGGIDDGIKRTRRGQHGTESG